MATTPGQETSERVAGYVEAYEVFLKAIPSKKILFYYQALPADAQARILTRVITVTGDEIQREVEKALSDT